MEQSSIKDFLNSSYQDAHGVRGSIKEVETNWFFVLYVYVETHTYYIYSKL